nr:MAG TPA: hypothetical protein [Caudoviricetes sp.]
MKWCQLYATKRKKALKIRLYLYKVPLSRYEKYTFCYILEY